MATQPVSRHDRELLRALAARQMEHAMSEKNGQLVKAWYRHNACRGERPLVHLMLKPFEHEIIPQLLQCEGEEARRVETTLYEAFLNLELFDDDHPVAAYYPIASGAHLIHFGLKVERVHVQGADGNPELGHRFTRYIDDLEADFGLLKPGRIVFNRQAMHERFAFIDDLFGDILPPKMVTNGLYSVPTQDVVHIMGMETMFMSMYDHPDLFHKMMRQYTDDTLRYFDFLERERLLWPTVGQESLGQATFCFTDELPSSPCDGSLKTENVWGFMDSQETVGVAPAMFGEFVFPYYKEIASRYGMMSYGCCEPVHPIWDEYLSTLSNLRKVSISAWCDEAFMAERLKGRKTIFHRKPSPNFLGVGAALEEDAFRRHIRTSIQTARGLPMEITQMDVYTIHHDIPKARRFVRIIKEEIDSNW